MKAVKLPSFLLALLLHLCFSAARENTLQVHPKEKVQQLLTEQPIHGVNLNVSSSSSRNGGGGELSLWRREMGEERDLKKSSSGGGGGGGSGGSGGKSGGGKGVGSGGKGGEGGGSQTTRQPRNEKSGGSLTRSHSFSSSTPLFLVSFLLLLWSD